LALVRSEVAGNIWKIETTVGAAVAEGDVLIIVESMKMEIPIEASTSGTVREIFIAEGELVAEGAVVMSIE